MSDATPILACAAPAAPRRSRGAWQPFTGSGVSRFGDAGGGRTLGFLGGFALATALTLGWALHTTGWPVMDHAVREFPEQGPALARGRFVWPEPTPRVLADSPHLAVAVRPGESETLGRTADLQLELLPGTLRLAGIAGFVDLPWPATFDLPLGRLEARAAWEAWRRPVLGALVTATAAALALVWGLAALLMSLPLRSMAWVLGRQVSLGGCWRMGAAAFMSASVVLDLGIGGYVMRWIPWPALAAVLVIHLLVGALYLNWGLVNRPRKTRSAGPSNPFHEGGPKARSGKSRSNPFG